MVKNKLKIYLCDLVHNFLGVGTYMFPLNIGYIGAYAKEKFGENLEVELFKYPDDFMRRLKESKPDLVGFSNYTWNADLNKQMSDWVKKNSPETFVVFGGPNINYSEQGYRRFFSGHSSADFYVLYQGEVAFANIIKRIFEKGLNLRDIQSDPIGGVVFLNKEKNQPVQGEKIPRIKDLNEVPSPYLTGILDKFFEANLIPIVETNRGCPYQCTYCCQGMSSYNKIDFYDLGRVKDELAYISKRVKSTNILVFADSNFGILERDVEIARHIAKLMRETGYPRRVSMNWAKNQPKIFEIAKILKNINLIISLQTLDPVCLKNIKRHNMQIPIFKDVIDKVNNAGAISGTEIILALPGETKQSHMNSLRTLFDWNVSYIICYNCLVLEGSEMSMMRESGAFECKTKFRLIDNSFGKYGEIISFETEEGIRNLPTITEEEILYFRPIHWLIQFLWNYRFYYGLLKYLQSLGINPLDYIKKLIDNIDSSNNYPEIKKLFQEFKEEAENEWFQTDEELRNHYNKPENFQWLKEGNYGKMNSKYIFRVLVEAKREFEDYLYESAINYSPVSNAKKEVINDLIKILSLTIIDFNKKWQEISRERFESFSYDILGWKNSGYKGDPRAIPAGVKKYEFFLSEEQKKSLEMLLKQYGHSNINATLRKMSEFMDIRDFFYEVK